MVVLNPEHEDLRNSIRQFLHVSCPESFVRSTMATSEGFDASQWQRACRELGVAGLIIPTEYGGSGFSFVELGVVLEESGRALWPSPLFASAVLATSAILTCADEAAKADYLPALANGDVRGSAVLDGDLVASRANDSWTVTGEARYVIDGHTADVIVAVAATSDGPMLFAVAAGAGGLTHNMQSTMDQTRKLAVVQFDSTPSRALGSSSPAAVTTLLQVAAVALAAEQVGAAQRLLELTVAYVNERTQFGRTIGSFQAVKHRCADMLVAVESARAAMIDALWSVAEGRDTVAVDASMAKAFCSDAFLDCAHATVQLHGGIGFTWEHPAHLYLKRAKSSQILFGDPDHHRDLIASILGL